MAENRIAVFVDGFNLYYAARAAKAKWLNIAALLEAQFTKPTDRIAYIHYFTARVDGKGDLQRPARQRTYIKALECDPRFKVHYGSFLTKEIDRPVARLFIADHTCDFPPTPLKLAPGSYNTTSPRGFAQKLHVYDATTAVPKMGPPVYARVLTREEKGSDVNLATQLLLSGLKNEYDLAVIVSNDSDLCSPIQVVRSEFAKDVVVCFTPQRKNQGVSEHLRRAATGILHIHPSSLRKHQFANPMIAAGTSTTTTLRKPDDW